MTRLELIGRSQQHLLDADAEKFQLEAGHKWFPIAPARHPRLHAMVYVADGVVVRLRAVTGNPSAWNDDGRGDADIPLGRPLTDLQIASRLPTLGVALGDPYPHIHGKICEYVMLQGTDTAWDGY